MRVREGDQRVVPALLHELLHDLRDNLGIAGLENVRIYNRYDLSGMTDEEYAAARSIVFSEPPVDEVYDETAPFPSDAFVFAVEPLPGQYDQRADSAVQCVQFLTGGQRPHPAWDLNATLRQRAALPR